MTVSSPDGQLELFDLSGQPTAKPRHTTLGRLVLQIRQDQLMVAGIAGLVGFTVVFALGVERGKQLVRSERVLFARQQPPPQPQAVAPAPSSVKTAQPVTAAPATAVTPRAPTKVATPGASRSRYAVQIVTYRQPQLAKRELERLQAKGERAFLVNRQGLTALCVGPFPSKDNAKAKLVQLKDRYQGCFLKTL